MIKAIIFDCFGVLSVEINVADATLFHYIRDELKPKYKIGLLSNVDENWLHRIFSAEQNALFDSVALSYEIGVNKPEPLSYQIIAQGLKVRPEDCLFVDDQERFCQGARQVGMEAICYRNFEQFKAEIEPIISSSQQ